MFSSRTVRFFDAAFSQLKADCLTVDDHGIRLAADPQGPLSYSSSDGSLGRRTLPRGFAISPSGKCYYLNPTTTQLLCFDALEEIDPAAPFRPVLRFEFKQPSNAPLAVPPGWALAASNELLYIIRPQHNALYVVCQRTWSIQQVQRFEASRQTLPVTDVVVSGSTATVLAGQFIYSNPGQSDAWMCLGRAPAESSRLLTDLEGGVHILIGNGRICRLIDVLDASSSLDQLVSTQRTMFPVPPVFTLNSGISSQARIYVASPLLTNPRFDSLSHQPPKPANELPPEVLTSEVDESMFDLSSVHGGFLFQADGSRIHRDEYSGSAERLFYSGKSGECACVSAPIDSGRYRCRWDEVQLDVTSMPPGSRVAVSTFTSDTEPTVIEGDLLPAEADWRELSTFTSAQGRLRFPVRSAPGRYLWIRVHLIGDGFSTPILLRVMASGPRYSLVEFLPAVMQEDELSRDFLERFLGVFQQFWDDIETQASESHHHFDPERVQVGLIPQLARWLGIDLPSNWSPDQQRRLMSAVSRPADTLTGCVAVNAAVGAMRGTLGYLRHYVQAILSGLTGLAPEQLLGFPWIIEGYRERNTFWLNGSRTDSGLESVARLDDPSTQAIWGADEAGRLKLGVNSRLGERKLLPVADSLVDLFRLYSHRIRIVVPAAWIQKPADRQVLENALEAEKPAHVQASITLVRPGMQIGLKSTVGIDTILADDRSCVLSDDSGPTFDLGRNVLLPSLPNRPPPLAVQGRLLPEHEL